MPAAIEKRPIRQEDVGEDLAGLIRLVDEILLDRLVTELLAGQRLLELRDDGVGGAEAVAYAAGVGDTRSG